jgi:hypothetical protein
LYSISLRRFADAGAQSAVQSMRRRTYAAENSSTIRKRVAYSYPEVAVHINCLTIRMLHLRLHHLIFYTSLLPLGSSLILGNNVNNNQRPVLSLSSFAYHSASEAGNIRIGNTQNKGLGAFARAPILNGTNLGAYEGEILSRPQVEARYWSIRKCKVDDRRWI